MSLFFVELSWSKLSVIPSESPMVLNLLPNVQSRILQTPSTWIPRTLSTLSGSKIINKCNDHAIAVDAVLALADLEKKDVDFELIKVESQVGGATMNIFFYFKTSVDMAVFQTVAHIKFENIR